ncbi:hypothetical protein HK101_004025, partial [Irineochytrium annulatum]
MPLPLPFPTTAPRSRDRETVAAAGPSLLSVSMAASTASPKRLRLPKSKIPRSSTVQGAGRQPDPGTTASRRSLDSIAPGARCSYSSDCSDGGDTGVGEILFSGPVLHIQEWDSLGGGGGKAWSWLTRGTAGRAKTRKTPVRLEIGTQKVVEYDLGEDGRSVGGHGRWWIRTSGVGFSLLRVKKGGECWFVLKGGGVKGEEEKRVYQGLYMGLRRSEGWEDRPGDEGRFRAERKGTEGWEGGSIREEREAAGKLEEEEDINGKTMNVTGLRHTFDPDTTLLDVLDVTGLDDVPIIEVSVSGDSVLDVASAIEDVVAALDAVDVHNTEEALETQDLSSVVDLGNSKVEVLPEEQDETSVAYTDDFQDDGGIGDEEGTVDEEEDEASRSTDGMELPGLEDEDGGIEGGQDAAPQDDGDGADTASERGEATEGDEADISVGGVRPGTTEFTVNATGADVAMPEEVGTLLRNNPDVPDRVVIDSAPKLLIPFSFPASTDTIDLTPAPNPAIGTPPETVSLCDLQQLDISSPPPSKVLRTFDALLHETHTTRASM